MLRELHARHPAAIPFENLDVLLGRPIIARPAALEAKLVYGGRGGYCFEHNTLMAAALEALGLQGDRPGRAGAVGPLPDDPPLPRTHMALRVDLPRGPYLVDVGFGGLTKTAPLRDASAMSSRTPEPACSGWSPSTPASGSRRGCRRAGRPCSRST